MQFLIALRQILTTQTTNFDIFDKKLFFSKTFFKNTCKSLMCHCIGIGIDFSELSWARTKETVPLESRAYGECAVAFLFAIRQKIKKWINGKNSNFSQKIGTFPEKMPEVFKKNLLKFSENLLPYMGICLTDAEHKIFNYSSTNTRIALKVGTKHFLQFILTDYGGIFTIHDAQRVLQTAKNRLFTHHKQDFTQFPI